MTRKDDPRARCAAALAAKGGAGCRPRVAVPLGREGRGDGRLGARRRAQAGKLRGRPHERDGEAGERHASQAHGGWGHRCSEFGLGTQRWGGADFNSPDETLCHAFLDRAVLEKGVSLIDTAEQYPIPSDRARPEGNTERIIGSWLAKDKSRREKVVLATKITGRSNVTKKNIVKDLEGSLRRGTVRDGLRRRVHSALRPRGTRRRATGDESLQYHGDTENAPWYRDHASFEEIAEAMSELIDAGKLRGWGMCNDNAYGLTASCYAAYSLQSGHAPCVMQNDFSLINRRVEENGVTEASSPAERERRFMAYNVLAGGVLTGKYLDVAAAVDNPRDPELAERLMSDPRGRMDDYSWGKTLYRSQRFSADDATRQSPPGSPTPTRVSLTTITARASRRAARAGA